MAKGISQYFKRIFDDYQVLVCIHPEDFTGIELILHPDGHVEKTNIVADEEIFEDLEACTSSSSFGQVLNKTK